MSRPQIDLVPLEFDPVIKFLHWLSVLLIVAVFVLAFSIDLVPTAEKQLFLQLHRSVGLAIWAITIGRLIWRQFTRFPNWPASMSLAVRTATTISEYALYLMLLVQPILGILHTGAHGDKVNLFFLGNLPPVLKPDRPFAKQLHDVHAMVGYLLLGLIGLHAVSGLYHHFWRRNHTLTAMLPRGLSLPSKPAEHVSG